MSWQLAPNGKIVNTDFLALLTTYNGPSPDNKHGVRGQGGLSAASTDLVDLTDPVYATNAEALDAAQAWLGGGDFPPPVV